MTGTAGKLSQILSDAVGAFSTAVDSVFTREGFDCQAHTKLQAEYWRTHNREPVQKTSLLQTFREVLAHDRSRDLCHAATKLPDSYWRNRRTFG